MAEVNNKVIKITVDTDKAKIKIEGVEGYFRKAETAAKALNKVLDQNTQKWGRTEAALSQQISSLKELRSKTAGTTEEYQRQTKQIDELQAEYDGLVGSQSKATKSMGSMESSAGIAGATVSELGRTISDMPYGITAVTNNISQLGSMFAILVQKTGSVQKAFQSLFATLRASPALAVLLAFQAVVAIIDVMAQKSKKADKAFTSLSQAVGESATELKIARDILNDSNVSLTKKEAILGEVNSKYKDLNITLDDNKLATLNSTNAIDAKISSLERLARSQAIVNEVSRIYGEMAELESKTGAEAADTLDYVNAQAQNLANTLQFVLTAGVVGEFSGFYAKKIEELGEESRKAGLEELQKTADALIEKLDNLFPDKDSNKGPLKKLKDLNLLIVQAEVEFLESLSETTEQEQIDKQKRIEQLKLLELDLLKKNALEKAKEEGRNGAELLAIEGIYQKKRLTLLNDSNAKIMAIMKSFNIALDAETRGIGEPTDEEVGLGFLNRIFGTDVKTVKEQLDEGSKKVIEGLAAYQKKRQEVEDNGNKAVNKLREGNKLIAIQSAQELGNSVADVMFASYQREIDIEQDKTNRINNELKERLANENLSADERKNIQNKIAANDEELRKKQDAIERKKFKMNKAASIANATINTYLAATAALKDPALSTFQRIASMVAIIGSGLAQVAVIAKQKFVSSQSGLSGTGAGGAGGGAGVQAPDFNIVGQSASNQLAAAVQGQFQQPVKAYVVSKDVSTAQEMDRNIIGSASLG